MTTSLNPRGENRAIGAIAVFEAFKGAIVLVAGCGLLLLLHHDLRAFAERLVAHTHLNPASHYPRIFIDTLGDVQNSRLVLLSLGALAYASLRFVEAYGLLRHAAWAELLAAASGGIYVPLEVAELVRHVSALGIAALLLNLAVVGIMVMALLRRRRGKVS